VFFIFGLGFVVQRFRPLSDQTLSQLSGLVVEILLPFYLFFITATSANQPLGIAPTLIFAGLVIPLLSYALAGLIGKVAGVTETQRTAFRFSIMVANTAFLGIPICEALFGPVGAIYAVLYDFGTTLIALTFGIWELSGGRLANWRPLLFNPLIWGVLAGLMWALTGFPFPGWLTEPLSILGDATLPLALLVGGAQIGNIRAHALTWWRPLTGLLLVRLIMVPLVVATVLTVGDLHELFIGVLIVESAMPVGLISAIFARNYNADATFAASATFWSTLVSAVTLPLVVIMLVS
jgi:predicted permease